jgi:hypothetical protein
MSAAAKAAETSACRGKAAGTSACRGDTRIASTVVRNASVVLVNRVVAKSVETILRVIHCGAWVASALLLPPMLRRTSEE